MNDEIQTAESILAENGIQFSREAAVFVCSKSPSCEVSLPEFEKPCRTHFKRYGHTVNAAQFSRLWKAMNTVRSVFPETHTLRHCYHTGGTRHGPLPPLPGLRTVKARKCLLCDELISKPDQLQRHLKLRHQRSYSIGVLKELPELSCQSLTKMKGSVRLFLVKPTSREGAVEPAKNLDAVISSISDYLFVEQAEQETVQADVHQRFRSPFSSAAQCAERLICHGLDIDKAAALSKSWRGEEEAELKRVANFVCMAVDENLSKARSCFSNVDSFRNTLLRVNTSGTIHKNGEVFRFVANKANGEGTQARYARQVRCFILIALRIYKRRNEFPKIAISQITAEALDSLLEVCKRGREEADIDLAELENAVHRVLKSIFFEKSGLRRGVTSLFASAIVAVMCVNWSEGGNHRYVTGQEMDRRITGVLYAFSCVGLLEIRMYGKPTEGQLDSEFEEEVLAHFLPTATCGGTVLVNMRSICSSIRDKEYEPCAFTKCRAHVDCGIVEGEHLSMQELGKIVKKMQQFVRAKIFGELMGSVNPPPNFAEKCYGLKDRQNEYKPGYWALSDERNKEFIYE